jgi:putative ABC transport system substrate-binding protein
MRCRDFIAALGHATVLLFTARARKAGSPPATGFVALFLAACSGFVLAPSAAGAQSTGKIPRVGILASTSGPGGVDDGIFQGLRDLGYIDQRNIILHTRWSAGRQELYSELASQLIKLEVDVIVASGPRCEAVFALTRSVPIVCSNLNDPLAKGLIASFNRPGGNVTGFLLLSPELFHKRFQLLKEAIPRIKRIGVLWRAENPILLDWSRTAARLNDLEMHATRIDRAEDIDVVFEAAGHNRLDALVTTQGPLFAIERDRIAQLGLKHRLPTMTGEPGFAVAGGLLQFGPDIEENWRHAATYVDKILKGEKAGYLPIEQPPPKLAVNLRTAKVLGLTVPTGTLLRADEVIQ